jgi:hypothetical protein
MDNENKRDGSLKVSFWNIILAFFDVRLTLISRGFEEIDRKCLVYVDKI